MPRHQNAPALTRPFLGLLEEAFAILRQDAGEYAFIALTGAFAACMAVVIPGLIGGPIAVATIAPLLVVVAVLTLGASAAALGVGSSQLQPDATRAFQETALRAGALLRPWLTLAVVLAAASYAADAYSSRLGPVPPEAIMLVLAAAALVYALPRSLHATALFEQDLSSGEASRASTAIVREANGTVASVWLVALAPATLVALLGVVAGIDPTTGAVIAVLFVGAMPVVGALMSQIFIDAASEIEAAPPPAPMGGAARWRV